MAKPKTTRKPASGTTHKKTAKKAVAPAPAAMPERFEHDFIFLRSAPLDGRTAHEFDSLREENVRHADRVAKLEQQLLAGEERERKSKEAIDALRGRLSSLLVDYSVLEHQLNEREG